MKLLHPFMRRSGDVLSLAKVNMNLYHIKNVATMKFHQFILTVLMSCPLLVSRAMFKCHCYTPKYLVIPPHLISELSQLT